MGYVELFLEFVAAATAEGEFGDVGEMGWVGGEVLWM